MSQINPQPKRQTLSLKVNDCFSHLNNALEIVHLRVEEVISDKMVTLSISRDGMRTWRSPETSYKAPILQGIQLGTTKRVSQPKFT